jgi:rhodanese-related sulfurtransferase
MNFWTRFGRGKNPSDKISQISVHELKERMDVDNSLLLIDVRTIEEYEAVRVPHIKARIDYQLIANQIDSDRFPKDQPLYLICRVGRRSLVAAQELADIGYEHLINISGGTSDWIRAEYPVIKQ